MSNFPSPQPFPLERLSVQDGLLLTAERWQCAHDYHRQRQSIYFQSLNQPGIVSGLGVTVIAPPTDVAAKYRDGRWVRISSGMAIDLVGNPIVVPEAIEFRIASEAREKPLMVYLTVSYVDPETLQTASKKEIVTETFRIDEKTSLPGNLEVELCRILLQPGTVSLENPTNVFFPRFNQLDLRDRQFVQARSQGVVRIAQLMSQYATEPEKTTSNLTFLLQSLTALYPALQGTSVGEVRRLETSSNLLQYDLLFLRPQQLLSLNDSEVEIIKQYAETGGVLLVEVPASETTVDELSLVRQQLQEAIADLKKEEAELKILSELEAELHSIEAELTSEITAISTDLKSFAQQIGIYWEGSGALSGSHPLQTQPFLFGQLPIINQQLIHIFNWGGIVLVIGDLSSAWGWNENLLLPRETIRTAQEMGINILNFAWRRRQLTQL